MNEHRPEMPSAANNAAPTNAMVERARQRVADAAATEDDLIAAASLLVACGVYDAARAALGRIDGGGPLKEEVASLIKTMNRMAGAPRDYSDALLKNAIGIAGNPAATDRQLLLAAENLVRWGSLDEADHALSRLRNAAGMKSKVARLEAASRQLRRSGILNDLSVVGDRESAVLSRPHEILVAKREGARRAILVFTGRGKRMWVTLSVFHQFLRRFDAHIFYLRDNSGHSYLNGLKSCGGDFQNLVGTLRRSVDELGAEDIHIMGNSSGGFAGLMAALEMKARSYLGFGIRTDLSTQAARRMHPWCRDARMLINLRPLIEQAVSPPRILLYCGELNADDRAEAENLRGAPSVEIHMIEGDQGHDTIAALLGRGGLEATLRRFVDEPA
jgi:hypothetical protein